jgi:hypothetical protein
MDSILALFWGKSSTSPPASKYLCLAAKKASVFIICLSINAVQEIAVRILMQRIATRLCVLSISLEHPDRSIAVDDGIEKDAAAALLHLWKIFFVSFYADVAISKHN